MSCTTTSLAHLPFFLISACSRYLFHFYEYLFSILHMNFVILNTIIIVLIFLSRRDTTRSINSSVPTCQEEATEAETEKAYNEEHIVVDAEYPDPVGKMPFDGSNAEMEAGKKMIRGCRFKRTQSEKLKLEHRLALGTILRRPETVVVSGDDDRASTSVDQVDSHADAFIAKQKRFWLAEKRAEKETEKAYNEEHIVVDSEHPDPVGKIQFDGSNAEMEVGKKMIRGSRFTRTQSEKLKREHRLAPGTILRQPETVVVSGDDERASTSVALQMLSLPNKKGFGWQRKWQKWGRKVTTVKYYFRARSTKRYKFLN